MKHDDRDGTTQLVAFWFEPRCFFFLYVHNLQRRKVAHLINSLIYFCGGDKDRNFKLKYTKVCAFSASFQGDNALKTVMNIDMF